MYVFLDINIAGRLYAQELEMLRFWEALYNIFSAQQNTDKKHFPVLHVKYHLDIEISVANSL
jgi:hypothetical protein